MLIHYLMVDLNGISSIIAKRKKKIQCSKCEKSREYLEYLAKELDAFKKAHNLFSNEKVASTKQTAPKRRKGRKARKANKGFSTQIPLRR